VKSSHGGTALASATPKAWFPFWKPKPAARLRVFCFPFAGGSASALHRWAEQLGPSVEVLAVQCPGRETRFQEPPLRNISTLVEALGPVMLPLLDRPFAFFGYSLGAVTSLMMAYWLRRAGAPVPRGMMMAAGIPPKLCKPRGAHALSDAGLIEELRRYGAAPPQVLAHQELMALLLPMIRADFEMLDTFAQPDEAPLDVPMAIWGGTEDLHPSPQALETWRDYTSQDCSIQLMPGGHFFILSAGQALCQSVKRTLIDWSPGVT
jgi:medium-chain acyl-[acyl-carrier-protein] hydrolase